MVMENCHRILISTHTSRVGCDFVRFVTTKYGIKFLLTHPVWDVTQRCMILFAITFTFLLTHPVWDVTERRKAWKLHLKISTHTSRVGCDADCIWVLVPSVFTFLLTHPVWDVTIKSYVDDSLVNFYSHIPCGM